MAEILFEGISTTTTSGKSVSHRFLRLRQPVDELDYQSSPVLRRGRAYTMPFVFVIQNKLVPQSCDHRKQTTAVEKYHVLLPLSLGDISASNAAPPADDRSPDMVCISYRLKVSILKKIVNDQQAHQSSCDHHEEDPCCLDSGRGAAIGYLHLSSILLYQESDSCEGSVLAGDDWAIDYGGLAAQADTPSASLFVPHFDSLHHAHITLGF